MESQKIVLLEELKGLEGVEDERLLSETKWACKTQVTADIEWISLWKKYLGDKNHVLYG